MKAMRYHGFGGLELLREDDIARRQPAEGEVGVKVAASSINPVDWKIGEGMLRGMIDHSIPFIAGMDFSGVVVERGAGVSDVALGERVFGATPLDRLGAFAEFLTVSASAVANVPKSISLTNAAAVPIAAMTAWHAIMSPSHAEIVAGQTVLVHGGAGGTGSFAVQFARWCGARVIATASSANAAFVQSLGAHQVIDYRKTRFEDAARNFDAIIDLVGGDVQCRLIPLIRKGGILTSIVSLPDQGLAERHGVRATMMALPDQRLAENHDRQVLGRIAELIDEGEIRVVVSEEYPLCQAARALALSRKGHVRGKILLTIDATV